MELEGRVAIVTGSGCGIGRTTREGFARGRAKVVADIRAVRPGPLRRHHDRMLLQPTA